MQKIPDGEAVWITDSDSYQDTSHHIWWLSFFLTIKWVCCRHRWKMGLHLLPVPVFCGIACFPQGTDRWRIFFIHKWICTWHFGWWVGMVSGYCLGTYPQKSKSCVSHFGAMYSAWVNQEQPAMSDNHNNKHDNLEGVFNMRHSGILTAYMQEFWSNLYM